MRRSGSVVAALWRILKAAKARHHVRMKRYFVRYRPRRNDPCPLCGKYSRRPRHAWHAACLKQWRRIYFQGRYYDLYKPLTVPIRGRLPKRVMTCVCCCKEFFVRRLDTIHCSARCRQKARRMIREAITPRIVLVAKSPAKTTTRALFLRLGLPVHTKFWAKNFVVLAKVAPRVFLLGRVCRSGRPRIGSYAVGWREGGSKNQVTIGSEKWMALAFAKKKALELERQRAATILVRGSADAKEVQLDWTG